MKTAYKYSIRRHLTRGENFGHFQIRRAQTEAKQGEVVEYINPELFSIVFIGCKLHNKKNQSIKIFEGDHKKPCAWILCESYEVRPTEETNGQELEYNPRKASNWRVLKTGENADNKIIEEIRTHKNKLFI